MLTLKEKTAQIRKELKDQGITNKMASVRGRYALYDESITITIKDITVSKKKVETIVDKYEEISYDEYNGEILEGGNTYIHVQFDWQVLEEAKKDFMELATEIYNNSQECGKNELYTPYRDDNKVIFYQAHYSNCNPPTISLSEIKVIKDEYGEFNSYDRLTSTIATCPEGIASALVQYKFQYGVNI